MSYTSFIFLLMLLFIFPVHAAEQTDAEEFLVTPMSEAITVQTKCGKYFGYNTYPGVAERCVSFNYESGTAVYIRTVAISTLKPTIDNSLEEPMVTFKSPEEVLLRIPQELYNAEKECMPDLENKEEK
jgi:hypothetical protein